MEHKSLTATPNQEATMTRPMDMRLPEDRRLYNFIHAASQDVGTRHMKANGRTTWSRADMTVAAREMERLYAAHGRI